MSAFLIAYIIYDIKTYLKKKKKMINVMKTGRDEIVWKI